MVGGTWFTGGGQLVGDEQLAGGVRGSLVDEGSLLVFFLEDMKMYLRGAGRDIMLERKTKT